MYDYTDNIDCSQPFFKFLKNIELNKKVIHFTHLLLEIKKN